MALPMARPFRHPKTGIFWLRKRVPEDLRPIVGKREEKFSLKTRDPSEAKRLHAEALAALESRWANLKAPPQSITEKQAHELAAPVYSWWIDTFRDNPSQQTFWKPQLFGRLWGKVDFSIDITKVDSELSNILKMEKLYKDNAGELIAQAGLTVDEASKAKIEKAVGTAIQRASLVLQKMAEGDFNEVEHQSFEDRHTQNNVSDKISFEEILDGWAKERKPVQKTLYEYKRNMKNLVTFLGHDDAARVSPKDLFAWKAKMVEEGLHPKTISGAKLGPVRAILQWAVDNGKLNGNPASKITAGLKTKTGEGIRGFTEDEALTILKGALKEKDPVKHWIPLLAGYTGARLSEICQLRTQDILELDGIWCLKIVPEAGHLKTSGSERAVPLHPALSRAGFLEWTSKLPKGPLFSDLTPDKFGKRGGNATKILGKWVRGLGLVDPRLSPSHSWRHRFKTLCRRFEVAQDVSDALSGHGRKNVASQYGEYPVEALYRELCKIPKIDI